MKYFILQLFIGSLFISEVWAQNTLNSPNLSANALFLYRHSNFSNRQESTEPNGLDIQELEVALYSEVDPYSRLKVLLAVHPEYEYTAPRVEKSWVLEPEEVYAETTHLPGLSIKLGKFKSAFGKHNLVHTHAFPFVDAPLAQSALLGEDGLNEMGLSGAYLIPTPWFSEFTLQYLKGDNETFNSPSPSDAVGLIHLKNLWDLTEELTFELGLSHAQGKNHMYERTLLNGVDFTFKSRSLKGDKSNSWTFAGEGIQRHLEQPNVQAEKDLSWNLWAQYHLSPRWSAAIRYDQLKTNGADSAINTVNALANDFTKKYSMAVVLSATEFSSYRLEYNYSDGPPIQNGNNDRIDRKIYLQANFTIGAHPAHTY